MKTVLITGCSSGFGLGTAKHFLDRDWRVIATMRTPSADLFPPTDRLQVLALDVTEPTSIGQAIEAAGPIDVLVNNAGIGLMGALEGITMVTTLAAFAVNTFGTIAMTQAVLPRFRERREGVIVNISSSTTLMPLPLLSIYTATKAAINAFTESLALELQPFGIRVHLVIPGRAPETPFSKNAQARVQGGIPDAYAAFARGVFARMGQQSSEVTHSSDVADAVWRAATDMSAPLRIPAGADAVALSVAR